VLPSSRTRMHVWVAYGYASQHWHDKGASDITVFPLLVRETLANTLALWQQTEPTHLANPEFLSKGLSQSTLTTANLPSRETVMGGEVVLSIVSKLSFSICTVHGTSLLNWHSKLAKCTGSTISSISNSFSPCQSHDSSNHRLQLCEICCPM
jgi:hypothetical protein